MNTINKHANEKFQLKRFLFQEAQLQQIRSSLEKKLEKSKKSDYRLYGGMRATLIFSPNCGLPNNEELDKLCLDLQPMMYTQLWRKWDPINIPVSTNLINVNGIRKLSFVSVRPVLSKARSKDSKL